MLIQNGGVRYKSGRFRDGHREDIILQGHRDVMMLLKVEENYRVGKSLDVSAEAWNSFGWVNS